MSESQKAAVKAVRNGKQPDTHELSTGYTVRFKPVSRFIIMDATQNIIDPPVPVIIDEEQGREYPNPNDPHYLREIEQNGMKRSMALAEVTLMLGVEVEEVMPPDSEWLPQLQWLEKRGRIDLSEYNLEDAMDKEYIFKRFVVFGDNDDFAKLMAKASGTDEAEVARAMDTFQRNALAEANNGSTTTES